jgi:acetyl-CoA carboxylase biotin carboxylase subunit
MNTRLQVEHPVTEWATGIDLVHWQIRIAAGKHLTIRQEDIAWRGSAMECRLYAEDPDNNFFPSPGQLVHYAEPGGPGVRVDGGVYEGWTVPIEYDPLLAKLTVWGETREIAIERMRRALAEYRVGGITTNLSLFEEVMKDETFRAGRLDTGFLDRFMRLWKRPEASDEVLLASMLAAGSADMKLAQFRATVQSSTGSAAWRATAQRGLLR